MRDYKIIQTTDEKYSFIVFSESYETPLMYLDKISQELKEYNKADIKVIFDMLLNMGNTPQRFAEATFDGGSFIESTFNYFEVSKKDKLRSIGTEFLRSNIDILNDSSVLNSVQKRMIKKGMVI